jgi:hypothetical protein
MDLQAYAGVDLVSVFETKLLQMRDLHGVIKFYFGV